VLVVGGGVAGLELALTATRRGLRDVRLVEAADELGGVARRLSRLPGLGEWEWLVSYREAQLRHHSPVRLSTGIALDAEAVLASGARVVIVATGASWLADGTSPHRHAPIPGWDAAHVTTPERVLAGYRPDGERVAVYDCEGYLTGVGLAELLAGEGCTVTLLTPHAVVGTFLDRTLEGAPTRARLHALGVDVRTSRDLIELEPGTCVLRHYGATEHLAVDAVVLATARRSDDALFRTLRADPGALARAGIEAVHRVGDCAAPRLLADCIFDAHRLARELESPRPDRPLAYRRERPA
jgi:dimethylamine/trimethylamine dehydrogenase